MTREEALEIAASYARILHDQGRGHLDPEVVESASTAVNALVNLANALPWAVPETGVQKAAGLRTAFEDWKPEPIETVFGLALWVWREDGEDWCLYVEGYTDRDYIASVTTCLDSFGTAVYGGIDGSGEYIGSGRLDTLEKAYAETINLLREVGSLPEIA